MELLALQDFGSFVFDDMTEEVVLQQPTDDPNPKPNDQVVVLNLPATPNCSSISSISSEAANEQEQGKAVVDEEDEEEEEEEQLQHNKTKKEVQVETQEDKSEETERAQICLHDKERG